MNYVLVFLFFFLFLFSLFPFSNFIQFPFVVVFVFDF